MIISTTATTNPRRHPSCQSRLHHVPRPLPATLTPHRRHPKRKTRSNHLRNKRLGRRYLLPCKTIPFGTRNHTFCRAKAYLLPTEVSPPPFESQHLPSRTTHPAQGKRRTRRGKTASRHKQKQENGEAVRRRKIARGAPRANANRAYRARAAGNRPASSPLCGCAPRARGGKCASWHSSTA